MRKSYVLLLSGSIVPHVALSQKGRVDAGKREEDYFKAIRFYLSKGYQVVFVENSNTRSEQILRLNQEFGGLEYLTFSTEKSHLGKASGEVEIMKYALDHSEQLNKVDYLIKITGRYIIQNIDAMVDGTNDFQSDIYINPTRNLRWADSRLMMMKKSFFNRYFLRAVELYLDESNGVFMEQTFVRSLFLYLLDGGQLQLWPVYPSYQGMDGTHDQPVTFSFLKSLKYNIYYTFKKFAFRHRA
jgi:hypothetical protein